MKRKMVTMTTQKVVEQCERLMATSSNWPKIMHIADKFGEGEYEVDGSHRYDVKIELLSSLADKGCYVAMNRLGVIYWNGDNVKQDLDKAFQLFEKAAEHGDALAKENLAWMLIMGPDHLKDVQRGVTLCLDTLNEKSHGSAFYTLACAYEEGAGVKQNIDLAFYFYQMAVAMGAPEDIPHAENELKLFKHKGISVKPLKHVDFFPKSKYDGMSFGYTDMKAAVYDAIDFNLPAMCWRIIDTTFDYIWDRTIGECVDYDGVFNEIKTRLDSCGLDGVVSNENLQKVFDVMIDFAKCTGGIIEESREQVEWEYDMDLIEYPSDAQLINVVTYDYNSHGQNYFMKIISQLISHAKCLAVVWCRKNSVESFATNLSVGFYGDEHYGAHFSLESTEREGVFKLSSRNESSDIADLYLIENKLLSVFDFNSCVRGCMKNYGTKYVFVDDIDNMELPSEFITLKSNRIFDMTMLTLKALALSLDIPVVIQKTVSHEHDFNDFNKPTLTNSVPFAEYLDDKADRIVVAYYDEKDGNACQNLQVVKDNKYSTGKVLITKEKNYYGL